MWDPTHIERGIDALSAYPDDRFAEQFRDFYEALQEPGRVVEDPAYSPGGEAVIKAFGIDETDTVQTVSDVVVIYGTSDGRGKQTAPYAEYDDYALVECVLPWAEFDDALTFPDRFRALVLDHLRCQIRDIYLNMGEEPPARYRIDGFGKHDIFGGELLHRQELGPVRSLTDECDPKG